MLVLNYAISSNILFNVVRNGSLLFWRGEGEVGESPPNILDWKENTLKKNLQGEHTLLPTKKIHAQPKGEKKNSYPRPLPRPLKNGLSLMITILNVSQMFLALPWVINKSLFKAPPHPMHHYASSSEPSRVVWIIKNHSFPCQLSSRETVNKGTFLGILKLSVHHIFSEFLWTEV